MFAGVLLSMRIDIWSDVVCPWCYIGKRRLEAALADFEHADEVEIHFHSYELDPAAPKVASERTLEALGRKYGGGVEGARRMMDQVEAAAAGEGLLFRLGETMHVNTSDAHRVLHLAADHGVQGALKEALLAAHFTRAENVSDTDVLVRHAVAAGLEESRVREVLSSDEYADAVEADIRQAASLGATGVPFVVVDGKYGVPGAQPADVFGQVLQRAWDDAHPQVQLVTGGDAEACGPDGCAI